MYMYPILISTCQKPPLLKDHLSRVPKGGLSKEVLTTTAPVCCVAAVGQDANHISIICTVVLMLSLDSSTFENRPFHSQEIRVIRLMCKFSLRNM